MLFDNIRKEKKRKRKKEIKKNYLFLLFATLARPLKAL
jgi:hypothetical protein